MKLFEFEAKEILRQYGISTPEGGVASTPEEAVQIAVMLNKPVALKSQVTVSGRGKAGGILFSDDPGDVGTLLSGLLGSSINGA